MPFKKRKAKLNVEGNVNVSGSLLVSNDNEIPTKRNAGAIRYRAKNNNSFIDICMQTNSNTWDWINVIKYEW